MTHFLEGLTASVTLGGGTRGWGTGHHGVGRAGEGMRLSPLDKPTAGARDSRLADIRRDFEGHLSCVLGPQTALGLTHRGTRSQIWLCNIRRNFYQSELVKKALSSLRWVLRSLSLEVCKLGGDHLCRDSGKSGPRFLAVRPWVDHCISPSRLSHL